MSMPIQKPGRSKQDYQTPDDFMEAVTRRFGPMDWDLAADENNSKCGKFFLGEEQDSLKCNWRSLGYSANLWLNPPFSGIEHWAQKCSLSTLQAGPKIFLLVPASVGSNWYRDHVEPYACVLGLNPRLTFKGCKDPYPKDMVLAVYYSGLRGFNTWRWK